jgi:hypothetical protein
MTLGCCLHALEIKATATPRMEQLASLRKWMHLSGSKKAAVLCLVDTETFVGDRSALFSIPRRHGRRVRLDRDEGHVE